MRNNTKSVELVSVELKTINSYQGFIEYLEYNVFGVSIINKIIKKVLLPRVRLELTAFRL